MPLAAGHHLRRDADQVKRLLLALALACALPGVAGASLLVVNTSVDGERARDTEVFLRQLENLKINYRMVPASAVLSTKEQRDSLAVGKWNPYGSTWEAYDAVAFPGHRRGSTATADSFTMISRPHTVPFIYLSDRSNSNALTTSANACSTGVGNGTATNSARNLRAFDPRTWRMFQVSLGVYYVRTADEASWGMMRRVLGKVSVNQTVGEDSPAASMVEQPDTVYCWARMFASTDAGTPLNLSFVSAGVAPRVLQAAPSLFISSNESGQQGTTSIVLVGLSFADSLTGGAILNNRPVRQYALVTEGAGCWAASSFTGITPADSAFVKISYDTLAALGVPIGVAVDPCSTGVASKAYLKNWFTSPNFYMIPQNTDRTPADNASFDYPCDMTGYTRNRQAYDDGTCDAASDTSISCLLKYGAAQVQMAFPGKHVARVILGCAQGAYMPQAGAATDLVTRFGGPMGLDSLFSAFVSAGYNTLLFNSRADPWWNLSAFGTDRYLYRVRPPAADGVSPDTLPGTMRTLRVFAYSSNGSNLTSQNEGINGRGRTDGANDAKVQYQSSAGQSVLHEFAYDLTSGGSGSLTSGAVTRPGAFEMKWFVNAMKTAQAYSWPGHVIVRVVRADQL